MGKQHILKSGNIYLLFENISSVFYCTNIKLENTTIK